VYHRSTAVTRGVLLRPSLQLPSSSPATHVSLGIIENSTPGWSGRGPPTSSPVSPPIPTSPSVSSLRNRPKSLERSLDFELSPDPLQLVSPSRQRDEEHDPFLADAEMHDPNSSPNGEGHHDAMPDRLANPSPPIFSPMQPSLSADPFVVPAPAPAEANRDETYDEMHDASSSANREGHHRDAMLDRLASSRPPSINLPQLSPSADPFVVHAPAPTEANRDEVYIDGGDENAAGGRYSMRTRQPRQLKPYAFDRLEYKHQLKYHPDAIVRFAGLRNPVESSPSPVPSNAGESGSDGAAGNSASGRSSNRIPASMHTNVRKRRRTGAKQPPTTHQGTSRVQPPTTPFGRVRRTSRSPVVDVFPRDPSLPDQDGDDAADAPMPWYPNAFNDMSSVLGSEDEPLSVVQRPPGASHTPPPRAKRRRVIAWFQRRVCRG
jgi:hypothetical protein